MAGDDGFLKGDDLQGGDAKGGGFEDGGLSGLELSALVEAARAKGAIPLTGVHDAYVVVPRYGHRVFADPFFGMEKLLAPPRARAAYSDRTAWLMATLSEFAYQPFETNDGRDRLTTDLSHANFMLVETLNDEASGTQGFLALRDGHFAVLAFRGTEKDRKDIMRDINARFFDTPDGKAHAGFVAGYKAVDPVVRAAIDRIAGSMPEGLFITGHSLGGALATVAAHELEKTYLLSACYTFGSPRVGVAEWSESVKTPVYRVVNGADGVPLVPPTALLSVVLKWLTHLPMLQILSKPVDKLIAMGFLGYQHVGDLRFLCGSREAAQLKGGSAASWARFRHVVVGIFGSAIKSMWPGALSALFSDHAIAGYRDRLHSIAVERNTD